MRTFVLGLLAVLVGLGCLVYPGPVELERVQKKRGRVYETVLYTRQSPSNKGTRVRPLSELRATLAYWTA